MARPDKVQTTTLEDLRNSVLETMEVLPVVAGSDFVLLRNIPLGVLRRNATQRHGVTRWERTTEGGLDVQTVDLHPKLLSERWEPYAKFVLYHEFLHALGWRMHDATFRALEAAWPDAAARSLGPSFTYAMRAGRADWWWVCPTCEKRFPRQRRGNGKYLCRSCRTVLVDVRAKEAQ